MADDAATQARNEFVDYGISGKLLVVANGLLTQMPLGVGGENMCAPHPTLPVHIEKSIDVQGEGSCLFKCFSEKSSFCDYVRRIALQLRRNKRIERYQQLLSLCDEFDRNCEEWEGNQSLLKECELLQVAVKLQRKLLNCKSATFERFNLLDTVMHEDPCLNEIATSDKFNWKIGNLMSLVQFDSAILISVVSGKRLNKIKFFERLNDSITVKLVYKTKFETSIWIRSVKMVENTEVGKALFFCLLVGKEKKVSSQFKVLAFELAEPKSGEKRRWCMSKDTRATSSFRVPFHVHDFCFPYPHATDSPEIALLSESRTNESVDFDIHVVTLNFSMDGCHVELDQASRYRVFPTCDAVLWRCFPMRIERTNQVRKFLVSSLQDVYLVDLCNAEPDVVDFTINPTNKSNCASFKSSASRPELAKSMPEEISAIISCIFSVRQGESSHLVLPAESISCVKLLCHPTRLLVAIATDTRLLVFDYVRERDRPELALSHMLAVPPTFIHTLALASTIDLANFDLILLLGNQMCKEVHLYYLRIYAETNGSLQIQLLNTPWQIAPLDVRSMFADENVTEQHLLFTRLVKCSLIGLAGFTFVRSLEPQPVSERLLSPSSLINDDCKPKSNENANVKDAASFTVLLSTEHGDLFAQTYYSNVVHSYAKNDCKPDLDQKGLGVQADLEMSDIESLRAFEAAVSRVFVSTQTDSVEQGPIRAMASGLSSSEPIEFVTKKNCFLLPNCYPRRLREQLLSGAEIRRIRKLLSRVYTILPPSHTDEPITATDNNARTSATSVHLSQPTEVPSAKRGRLQGRNLAQSYRLKMVNASQFYALVRQDALSLKNQFYESKSNDVHSQPSTSNSCANDPSFGLLYAHFVAKQAAENREVQRTFLALNDEALVAKTPIDRRIEKIWNADDLDYVFDELEEDLRSQPQYSDNESDAEATTGDGVTRNHSPSDRSAEEMSEYECL